MADPTQIHQVAMNLMTNAFHAVESKEGTISVQLKEIMLKENDLAELDLSEGKHVQLIIADNGYGIPRKLIPQVFDPYFTTKEKGKGTGLGLAVAYGIIKEYNGDITVESQAGKGCVFSIYLPIVEKDAVNILGKSEPELPTGKERILVVDDEKVVAEVETQILKRLGYDAISYHDSLSTLERFKHNPNEFDLIVSDMSMPKMTGYRLAKEILATRPDMPIIICTGFSDKLDKEKLAMIGVKGVLMKPVMKSDLAQMVKKVLKAERP
ncbi:MAG: hypothetical protein CSA29_00565 [Desulfobacterales bacterium]|nr:MAG: hypothetical protein CSA29_00565 [Desulfobacterales bacterium]